MAKYGVEIKPSARRELEKLNNTFLTRVAPKIESLGGNPRPPGCRKLRGYKDLWRIRVGDYRVVYVIDDDNKVISVIRIAHRKDIYE